MLARGRHRLPPGPGGAHPRAAAARLGHDAEQPGGCAADQGVRTGGEGGTQLLAEAVTAYRQALEVRTRETLPQQWATTQNNLGNALGDQGSRTGGEARRPVAGRGRHRLPPGPGGPHARDTAATVGQTHNNLAEAYIALEDWPNAAASYANVLQVYPDDKEAYSTASHLYHEVLFQFPKPLR